MQTVYIETSVVSYLTALPARDLLAAAWQSATLQWWKTRRQGFELFTSQLVLDEAAAGNADAAERRLSSLADIPMLPITDAASELAASLLKDGALPEKAADDALHLAIAAYHGVDYLLTWNCRHLDNAEMKPVMRSVCAIHGFACPEICTPLELMGDEHEG
ncbi:MAG TPA: type II toxin-antitoxin system VapC family toxin [Kiritimatiellia bacterium]|nr:type II toxin-antitoxin system VapC family toxin [Kiritimatiellia bacterium]HMO97990.1 type II toxin-antitoxin system VapC family toxin [Kiritimatiellia bacterium]HMP95341.1 type II toxin-antitoxin system VapC family toxin [Kiritimatiellia bacterium]